MGRRLRGPDEPAPEDFVHILVVLAGLTAFTVLEDGHISRSRDEGVGRVEIHVSVLAGDLIVFVLVLDGQTLLLQLPQDHRTVDVGHGDARRRRSRDGIQASVALDRRHELVGSCGVDHVGVGVPFGAQVRGGAVEPVVGRIPFHDDVRIGLRVVAGVGRHVIAVPAPFRGGTGLVLSAVQDEGAAVVGLVVAVHITVDVSEVSVADDDRAGRVGIPGEFDLVVCAAVNLIGVAVRPDGTDIQVDERDAAGKIGSLPILSVDAARDRAVLDGDGLVRLIVLQVDLVDRMAVQVQFAVGAGDGDDVRDIFLDHEFGILARILVELVQNPLKVGGRDFERAFHIGRVPDADGTHGAAVRLVMRRHFLRVRTDMQVVGTVSPVGNRPVAAPVADILARPAVLVPDTGERQENGVVLKAGLLAGDLPADQGAAFLELDGGTVAPGPFAVVQQFLLLLARRGGPVLSPEGGRRIVRRIGIRGGIQDALVRIVTAHHVRVGVIRHAGITVDGGAHVELRPLGTAGPQLHPGLGAAAILVGAARGRAQFAEVQRDGGHVAAGYGDVRGGGARLDFPIDRHDRDLERLVRSRRNGDEERNGFLADGNAFLAAIQRDAGRTGYHGGIPFVHCECAAEALVGREDDLADLLVGLRGTHLDPHDAAEVLESQILGLGNRVHRRRVDITRHVFLRGGKRRRPFVVNGRGEVRLVTRGCSFLTADKVENALAGDAFRRIEADITGSVDNGDPVPFAPEDVEVLPVRAQGRPGGRRLRGGFEGTL